MEGKNEFSQIVRYIHNHKPYEFTMTVVYEKPVSGKGIANQALYDILERIRLWMISMSAEEALEYRQKDLQTAKDFREFGYMEDTMKAARSACDWHRLYRAKLKEAEQPLAAP